MPLKVPHLTKELRQQAVVQFMGIYLFVSLCECIVIIAIGGWIAATRSYTSCQFIEQFYLPVYIMLAASGVLVLSLLAGFVAMRQQNKPKFVRYFLLMLTVVIIMEILAGITSAVYLRQVNDSSFYDAMKSSQQQYLMDKVTMSCWDGFQKERKCCGTFNFNEWVSIFDESTSSNFTYPESCICDKANENCVLPLEQNTTSTGDILVFEKGCSLGIQNKLETILLLLTVISFSIVLIQIAMTSFSLFMATRFVNSSVIEVYIMDEYAEQINPNLASLSRTKLEASSFNTDPQAAPSSACWSQAESNM